MLPMRPRFSPTLTALALALAGASPAQEVSPAAQSQALDTLFKLGLPDSRGAKWVQARFPDGSGTDPALPGAEGVQYSGNAWLVREEKGVVELIVDHTRRVRARRAKGDEDESAGKLPTAQIQEADLAKDLATLTAALKPGGKPVNRAIRVGGQYLSGNEALPAMAAGAVLFAAHLQRQGRAEEAQSILRGALAYAPGPGTLDSAVSRIADARLRLLGEAFFAERDHADYARAIEKLAGEFPRGWQSRAAALLLAKRAAEQKPAPSSNDPVAKKAAALLLSLKKDQVESLPLESNWLFAVPGEAPQPRRYRGRRMMMSGGSAPEGALAEFFAQPRAAFSGVARLLDDRRLLPLWRDDISDSGVSFFNSETGDEQRIRLEYNKLSRPLELRELAWALIEKVLPDNLRSEIDDLETGRTEKVLAWFSTISAMNDDDLAWTALRQSDGANDSNFAPALGFLVQKGNAASQKRLADVFLDPAVWSNGADDGVLTQVEAYAAKLGPAAAAFGEKLRPIVATAVKAQNAEQMSNFGEGMNAEMRKMYERQADGQLKKFDQIFKPQGLAEMLAELANADKESSMEMWETLQGQLGKVPWAQAEAQLFQLAPKVKDPAVRSGILSLIMQHESEESPGKKTAPAAPDAATRAAIETLLADPTPLPEPIYWVASARDFSDMTAVTFALPRVPEADRARWQEHLQKTPEFALAWLKAHARALAAAQPAPPMPAASRVPAARADEILKEVVALPPDKILPALLARTPDEQAAVIEQLGKSAEWPPAFVQARLLVTSSQNDDEELRKVFDVSRWTGRKFDETVRKEITEDAEKAALDGHGCMISVSPVGLLGGLKVIVQQPNRGPGNLDKKQLSSSKTPLLEGQPAPDAIVALYFSARQNERSKPVTFAYALWKNPDLSKTWREKFVKPAEPGAKPEPEDGEAARSRLSGFPGKTNDPTPFDNALADIIAGKPAARGQFALWWMVRTIGENKDDEDH